MYFGENVTDDTKDAEINRLREQLNDIRSGNFDSLPALDAMTIDVGEIEIIGDEMGGKLAERMDAVVSDYLTVFNSQTAQYQNFRDHVSNVLVKDLAVDVLTKFLNYNS